MNIISSLFGKKNNDIGKEIFIDESKTKAEKDCKIIEGDPRSSLGWGVTYRGKNFVTHSRLPLSQSSLVTFSPWQKNVILAFIFLLVFGLFFDLKATLMVFLAILTFIYFIDFLFSIYILLKSLNDPPEIKFSKSELSEISEAELPIYSILCPLYKEDKVLPQFLKAIDDLDWPKEKLDVMLLLQA